jgi:hypothetical protein
MACPHQGGGGAEEEGHAGADVGEEDSEEGGCGTARIPAPWALKLVADMVKLPKKIRRALPQWLPETSTPQTGLHMSSKRNARA